MTTASHRRRRHRIIDKTTLQSKILDTTPNKSAKFLKFVIKTNNKNK